MNGWWDYLVEFMGYIPKMMATSNLLVPGYDPTVEVPTVEVQRSFSDGQCWWVPIQRITWYRLIDWYIDVCWCLFIMFIMFTVFWYLLYKFLKGWFGSTANRIQSCLLVPNGPHKNLETFPGWRGLVDFSMISTSRFTWDLLSFNIIKSWKSIQCESKFTDHYGGIVSKFGPPPCHPILKTYF